MLGVVEEADTDLGVVDQDFEIAAQARPVDVVVARDRDHRAVGKTAQPRRTGIDDVVAEDAEGLFRHAVAARAVEMVQRRLRAPADEHRPMHVGLRPIHDVEHFRPVPHLLEGQVGDWRAGDDEAVELVPAHLVPGLVEGGQIVLGRVPGLVVGDAHQRQVDLQRRAANQAAELGFGAFLVGHQVQQADLQRTDVLPGGAG